jgi:hypothetical protein
MTWLANENLSCVGVGCSDFLGFGSAVGAYRQ